MDETLNNKTEQIEEGGSLLQLAAIVEESHDAIIGKTLDGIVTSWNGGATKMFGYSPVEVVGKSMTSLFPPELKDELPRLLEKVRRGEVVADYDSIWLRKNGTRADVEFSVSPVHSEAGVIVGASLVGRDISERKKGEESMRQIQLIVKNSYDAIIGETLDGIVTSWNGGAAKMFGYSAEEIVGRSVSMLYPSELQNELPVLLGKVSRGEAVADHDSVRVCKDGSRLNVAFSSSPVMNEGGTVIGISCVERDISKRMLSDARIQRMTHLYAALSECNKAVVHAYDEVELFQQVCKAAVDFGGMTMAWVGLVDEVSKQINPVASFGSGTEYVHDILISMDANDPFGRGPTGTSIRENHPIWCQDFENDPTTEPWHARAKEIGWYSSAALPLVRNGIPVGSLTLYSDTINSFDDDAQKLLTEMASDISFALDNFADDRHMKELNEVRNKFISIISHQLRTPLTSINWNLEMVLNGDFGKLEDITRKFLLVTHGASVEITNRIHDLLAAMDIEEGRVVFNTEEVSLDSIVAGIVGEMKNKAELKSVSVQYIAPTIELPSVEVDVEKIRTAINKLVENAIIYNKEGGSVIVSLEVRDGMYHFEVRDTGIGIPEQEQHYIFGRFFRASNASIMQPDAFGLGLFITHSFIKQHGGDLGFTSKEGEGSTFWFEIPMKQVHR